MRDASYSRYRHLFLFAATAGTVNEIEYSCGLYVVKIDLTWSNQQNESDEKDRKKPHFESRKRDFLLFDRHL